MVFRDKAATILQPKGFSGTKGTYINIGLDLVRDIDGERDGKAVEWKFALCPRKVSEDTAFMSRRVSHANMDKMVAQMISDFLCEDNNEEWWEPNWVVIEFKFGFLSPGRMDRSQAPGYP